MRRHLLAVVVVALASSCTGASSGAPPEALARGETIYQQSCVQCHGAATGGQISDIPPVHNANGHTWHHPDCVLEDIVRDGLPPRSDPDRPVMPAFGHELSEADIEAVIDYVSTWWTEDQRSQQAEVTLQACD